MKGGQEMSEGDSGVKDLTGLGELANSQIVNKMYDDGLTGTVTETGKALTDITKTFRLFLAPFQYGALWQDRFAAYLDSVRSAVPTERQVEAVPEIAGPVLEKLRFQSVDSPLTELYLNLLKRAIDKERRDEAHPAFANIIAQLSADEALFLFLLRKELLRHADQRMNREVKLYEIEQQASPFADNLPMYIEHLRGLNLLAPLEFKLKNKPEPIFGSDSRARIGETFFGEDGGLDIDIAEQNHVVRLSAFGVQFCKACLPDE